MDDINEMLSSLLSDPKSVEMLKGIAAELSGESEKQEKKEESVPDLSGLSDMASLFSGLDPSFLLTASSLFSSFNSVDTGKISLLNSLKPYISPERQGRVDGAIRMLRIFKVASALGITPEKLFGKRG
ncbi:MAG: hypothetical protein IJD95_05300 [Clostridia bacterium]|nr:hypothetical protein [Clostridia bacterium]MBR2327049.1 hypothetical protein [Clostridia bacterium]